MLRSSTGFEMHLDEAVVDTGSGEVVSNKPVEVFTQDTTLNADRLEVDKSGDDRPLHRRRGDELSSRGARRSPSSRRPSDERTREDIDRTAGDARWRRFRCGAIAGRASAQSGASRGGTAPNALQGFQQNRGQPVKIEAASPRGPRQGQGRDLHRQREGRAGRHHHALQVAGGVLRAAGQGRPQAQADASHDGRDARPRRLVADQPAGSQRRRHRHPEGPDRHRRHAGCST